MTFVNKNLQGIALRPDDRRRAVFRPLGMTIRHASAVAWLFLVAGCSDPPGDSRYTVTLDVSSWIADLGADDPVTGEAAIELLAGLGESALSPLRHALETEGPAVRAGAVETLKQLDLPGSIPLLVLAATDRDASVRAEALLGLGEIGDDRGRPVVEAALEEKDREIVLAAADACASLCRSPKSLQRLTEMAIREPPFVAMAVPRQTLRYMARQGDDRASLTRDTIRATALPLLEPTTPAEVRTRAALLLADIGDTAGIVWLNRAIVGPLKMKPSVQKQIRLQAILAIGASGNAGSVAALRRARQELDPGMKQPICRALRQLAERGVNGAAAESALCGEGGRGGAF